MNPYPGLRPFTASEVNYFCGRDGFDRSVATRAWVSPVTVLFAHSGVGKSSFLTCKLLPRLQEHCRTIYINEWGALPPLALVHSSLETLSQRNEDQEDKPV